MDELNKEKYRKLERLSEGNFLAFLYDCDGTLADNMEAHRQTYVHVAASMGVSINVDVIDELAGYPVVDVVTELNKRFNAKMDPLKFASARHRLYVDHYSSKVSPISFVVNHLIAHAGLIKIGIVSGAERESVEKTLKDFGLLHLIDVIICAGETPRGKPYPDPFLAAAEILGIPPSRCLVFEDGDAGIKGANEAGMKAIRVDYIN